MQKAAILSLASVVVISTSFVSCATKSDNNLQLATGSVAAEQSTVASKLYSQAASQEKAGKISKAAKAYSKVAEFYPLSEYGSKANLKAAELLFDSGKLIPSFDSYQQFITRYHGTSQYNKALKQQEAVAHAAASGQIKNNFIGLKSKIPRSKTETMLTQVRDNAPFAKSAPKAQFTIGHMWETKGNLRKAIAAYEEVQVRYPKSKYAPQALYKVGSLILKQADKGNRNQGNLDTAKARFNDIVSLYPRTKEASQAKKQIQKIKQSDITRSFENAEFYANKGQHTAAIFYYNEVIRKSKKGSDLHNLAKQRISHLSQ